MRRVAIVRSSRAMGFCKTARGRSWTSQEYNREFFVQCKKVASLLVLSRWNLGNKPYQTVSGSPSYSSDRLQLQYYSDPMCAIFGILAIEDYVAVAWGSWNCLSWRLGITVIVHESRNLLSFAADSWQCIVWVWGRQCSIVLVQIVTSCLVSLVLL